MAIQDTNTFTARTVPPVAGTRKAVFPAGANKPEIMASELEAIVINKLTDEARSNSAALADDSRLLIPLLANQSYWFRFFVLYLTGVTADFKWRINGPASPTSIYFRRGGILSNGTASTGIALESAYSAADHQMLSGAATGGWVEAEGVIRNGANAGNLAFRWAQDTSDAAATTVLVGSFAAYRLIG